MVQQIEITLKPERRGFLSKAVCFGILLFLYIIIGVVPIQSAILRTDNPTSKSYTYVVALVGGGNNPQPGEISLAHNGVLFLDELNPEGEAFYTHVGFQYEGDSQWGGHSMKHLVL